ncbi:MAG: N-acetylmuramoyl-L-alanine amidase [Candidatus Omnitrophica bacterium]|nr:N-acetylmuramoyl-L-alanine amidase [Candidatus Omnitrophota bacterium]MDD5573760.1 N-acetylmuramoyl-L-alanine amidase [Candidatus Omnitrophota bacterium]
MGHFFSGAAGRCCVVAAFLVSLASCATVPSSSTDMVFKPVYETGVRHDMYHVIGPAETVYRIGRMYDVSTDAILKANGISDPRGLKVGQRILVPGAAPLRPVIPLFRSGKWRYIVVHHSVTDEGDATSLDRIHRRRGFDRGLGYHFVIDHGSGTRRDGQIEASPRWVKQMDGAHCRAGGMNDCGIGICVVGDFTREQPTRAQMDSLVLLVNTLREYYHIPVSRVIRHKDAPGARTECPGNSFPWQEFKRRLKRGMP